MRLFGGGWRGGRGRGREGEGVILGMAGVGFLGIGTGFRLGIGGFWERGFMGNVFVVIVHELLVHRRYTYVKNDW